MLSKNCDDPYTIDPTGEKKVILSVDGGGMRGAIPIAMLARLEAATGQTTQDMFDMVVGTSTGAIIAVGLAVGISAQRLLEEVYQDLLPKAFLGSRTSRLARLLAKPLNKLLPLGEDFIAGILTNRFGYAYRLKPFLDGLFPLLKEQGILNVGDLKYQTNPILLATTKDVRTSDTYFIVNAGKGTGHFQDWPLTGVVAASGAAPVFFPPVISRLVDGGVGVYNNPCLAAAAEAMEYIGTAETDEPALNEHLQGFRDGNVILISLGTGYIPNNLADEMPDKMKVWDWLRYVISESLDDAALHQVFMTRTIYGRKSDGEAGRIDFRRYNPLLTPESMSQELGISLDGRPDPSQLGLASAKDDEVELMVEIGQKYAEQICWSAPDIMPWDTTGGHHRPSPRDVFENNMKNIPPVWLGFPS